MTGQQQQQRTHYWLPSQGGRGCNNEKTAFPHPFLSSAITLVCLLTRMGTELRKSIAILGLNKHDRQQQQQGGHGWPVPVPNLSYLRLFL